jgi:predicted phage terminase large subunit-like protein
MVSATREAVRRTVTLAEKATRADHAEAQGDPNLFAGWVLKDPAGARVVQAEIHRLIQDFWTWCLENGRHGLVLAPWGHGKSEQTAIARVLHMLGQDPNLRIKVVCNTDDNARARVLSLRRYLEHDPDLRAVFPGLRLGREETSTSKITVDRVGLGKDPSVEAYGILSSSLGSRCDVLVCDDVVDLSNAIRQPSRREAVKQGFREGFLSRLEPGGVCLYIATIWHLQDLTMETLKAARAGHGFAAMVMKVSDDLDRIDVEVANADGFDAPDSIPLWAAKWSRERLLHRRDEEGLGTIGFARGYQQRPISDEDALFSESWFRSGGISRFTLNDDDPDNYDCYAGVDPAISSKPGANEFALTVVGHHREDKKLRLLMRLRKKGLSVKGQALAIVNAFVKYRMLNTVIESNAYQEALRQRLEELARDAGCYIPCEGVPSTKDKALYIGAWSPLVESGQFEIDADRFPDVVEDAITFPVGPSPDVLDAISRAVRAANTGPAVFLEDDLPDIPEASRASSWKPTIQGGRR